MSDSLRLAAGVIMTGFDAIAVDAGLRERLNVVPFAGFILFARNVMDIEQVRALTDALRACSDPPPIIAVDQEGGRVARLRAGVEELPPMMALGATRNAQLARRAGEQLGFDLRRAGFTHDFAPTVDLALDRANTVIGSRAIGQSPDLVTELGSAFISGMRDAGIGATIKHFPGHGATATDSHLAIPFVDASVATLRARDLVPFQALLPHVASIMASHVVARSFDAALPASLSARLLTGLLRDEWSYDGVCFTDCMQMDAIAQGIGTVAGVTAAIAAGADCALVSHDVELAVAAARHLAKEIDAGRVPVTRVEEAYARVMRLRRDALPPIALDAAPPHRGVGHEIARDAVTLVRGIPHADATGSIIVSFQGRTFEGAQGAVDLTASLRQEAPALQERVAPLDPSHAEVDELIEHVVASRRRPIVLARRAHLFDDQRAAISRIVERLPDTMVVSAREPYDCELFPDARHLLAIYGDTAVSLGGLADVIFGDGDAKGELPVDLTFA